MNDRHRSSWLAGADAGDLRAIHDRLPAYYRDEASELVPCVGRAEELLGAARSALRGLEERVVASGLPAFGRREGEGTVEAVAQWLAARHGAEPAIWNGARAFRHPAGGLELRRSRLPSAVIAWEKESFSSATEPFELPLRLLPPGARVVVVLLARMPAGGVPRFGERTAGEVLWAWPRCSRQPVGGGEETA